MPRIVFTPSGLGAEVSLGTTVLQAARDLGVDLDSVCGGRGICGRCQVTVTAGSYPKWAIEQDESSLTPFNETEAAYSARRRLAADRRLGCTAGICGDVVVDVPPESQVHRPVVRKSIDLTGVVLDPAVALYFLRIPPSVLGDAESMTDLVTAEMRATFDKAIVGYDLRSLQRLHDAFSGIDRSATIAVRDGVVVMAWRGFTERVYGVAVDIGSTTIAGHLVELTSGDIVASAGRMNPQIRFGEDLMSRVSYVMMNKGGDRQLTDAVRGALDELIAELCDAASTSNDDEASPVTRDDILEIVLVGNPVMHHIVAGIDPTPLGQAPFTLATAEAIEVRAEQFDIDCPHARVYLAPCIAGHVGADTAAVILAEGPHRSPTTQLLVDVGTNAEIVLGDAHRQFAASSPTGPAFEGAQLSCGQRATAGAVERVRIDPDTLEARVKVIGCDLWSDDPGFAAATTDLDISGICGSGIIEVVGEMYLHGIIDTDGVVQGALTARSSRIVAEGRTFTYVVFERGDTRLTITQTDIRAIQLAKAALRAGIELLLRHAGLDAVHDIRLAGAFGSHIDPVYALVLGLVPDCPVDQVRSVGNSAGAGAVRALLSIVARREMESAVQGVVKIETATEPTFQAEFVAAMAFPHATAPSTHLSGVVALPERTVSVAAATDRGRRRRDRTAAPIPSSAPAESPQGGTPS